MAAGPHELGLLTNVTMALVGAFGGGFAARKVGLPPMAGYLLAGVAIGPFTPGFVGDPAEIGQLAEMGVIFMMFGVGLHFSLGDLWRVRRIAIPGAILQMLISAALGFTLARSWGWTTEAALVLGTALSIASTVVLLRGLMDQGLLNSFHGQVAVGWLVLEDLATIAILVLMPALVGSGQAPGGPWIPVAAALGKTAVFVVLMLLVGKRALPWLLTHISHTRSRELFLLAVVALALGVAMGAAWVFGVSLALGAFLAGVVIHESHVGHKVAAELLPFRDVFVVLFFVSVGMLVNVGDLVRDWKQVAALVSLVVVGKAVLTLFLGFVLPAPARTMLVVAAGLSQIGEFSFIVGQAGLGLGLLDSGQYGLILAAALFSIVLNPLLFRALPRVERLLARAPRFYRRLDRVGRRGLPPSPPVQEGHVVVVGLGRVGAYVLTVLQRLSIPVVVVEQETSVAETFQKQGIPTLLGDAANSEILTLTGLPSARALVVAVPDEVGSELIVSAARDLAPDLTIVVRAGSRDGARRLAEQGAQAVIQPELEGGLEVVRYTLLLMGYPLDVMQRHADAIRQEAYEESGAPVQHRLLDALVSASRGVGIAWRTLESGSPLDGRTLSEAALRARTGATVLAVLRGRQLLTNPSPDETLGGGDRLGLVGEPHQIEAAEVLLAPAASKEP